MAQRYPAPATIAVSHAGLSPDERLVRGDAILLAKAASKPIVATQSFSDERVTFAKRMAARPKCAG
jgi:hypothetical protein